MIASFLLRLDFWSVLGLVIFAGCFTTAGWVLRGERELWLRTPAGRRWSRSKRSRGGFLGTRTPW